MPVSTCSLVVPESGTICPTSCFQTVLHQFFLFIKTFRISLIVSYWLTVPLIMSVMFWQRINANGWAPNGLFSWKKKIQWSHNEYYESLLLNCSVIRGNNLLTPSAADPHSSHLEWVLLCRFSCFPHLCWVPSNSFHQTRMGWAPLPPFPADRFQEALDLGNCPFFCRGHLQCFFLLI